jgi:CheY-like chemotaxis protein
LNETIEKVASTVGRTRKDVVLHLDLAPDLRPVEADLHQIEQVLLNLYINACDAMPEGGDLSVSTVNAREEGRPMVEIRVEDTGAGMDPEIMDRIFDPFFTTKELGRGTGLGLASSYGIVESHGGRIEVDSQPGVGTTFRVLLPAAQSDAVRKPDRVEAPARGRGRILIVDDEALVLRATARLVRSLGYEVVTAESGEEGIERYREAAGDIDLVVLDMVMPGLGGRQVFERLEALDPDVRVVVCSGYSVEDETMEAVVSRCRGRIQKPYTLEALATILEAALHDAAPGDPGPAPVR